MEMEMTMRFKFCESTNKGLGNRFGIVDTHWLVKRRYIFSTTLS